MTTDEAFAKLINDSHLSHKVGLSNGMRRRYRHQLKMDRYIRLDTEMRLLTQTGLRCATLWY